MNQINYYIIKYKLFMWRFLLVFPSKLSVKIFINRSKWVNKGVKKLIFILLQIY